MSRRKKVFISHSTETDENLEFLNQVCNALNENFDVLVDQQTLEPSDQWHSCILEWMYECDAVVILMSRRALEDSPWVKAEATVTSVRRRNENNFKLIVVPLDDVDVQHIQQDPFFGDIARLQDFQFAPTCCGWDSTVAAINAALQDLQVSNSPFEKITTRIRQTLRGVEDEALEDAIALLTCENYPEISARQCRADALARALFRGNTALLANLRVLIEELAHVLDIHKKAPILLEMLKGLWVSVEAAAKLVEARESKATISINSSRLENFTGACYARNAWPFPKRIHEIPAGNDWTLSALKKVLIGSVAKSERDPSLAEQRLLECKHPILLMFPAPTPSVDGIDMFPDEDLIDKLKQEHPNVTVLIATGEKEENQKQIQHFAQPLLPKLDSGEEESQYRNYHEVLDFIRYMKELTEV